MPKSAIFTPAPRIEQDVLGLDIPVQDALVVGELEGVADPWHQQHRLLRRKASCLHGLAQIDPIDVLHEQVEELTALPKIVHRHDVRVVEPGQESGFAVEAFRKGGVARERLRQELERHQAIELWLARLIHQPHAALANQFDDLQLWKSRGHRRKRRGRGFFARLAGLSGYGDGGEHALRTKPLRRIGRQCGLALGTAIGNRFSCHSPRFLRNLSAKVTRNRCDYPNRSSESVPLATGCAVP